MADNIGQLAVKVSVDSAGVKAGMGEVTQSVEKADKEMAKMMGENTKIMNEQAAERSAQMKTVGTAMLGIGASITAAMTMSVIAAEGERTSIAGLTSVLKNAGVAYDDVAESLNAMIAKGRVASFGSDHRGLRAGGCGLTRGPRLGGRKADFRGGRGDDVGKGVRWEYGRFGKNGNRG
jgi:hypothetical protein